MAFTVACLLQLAGDGAPPHTRDMIHRRTVQSSGSCPRIRAATSAPAAVRPALPAARASFHLVRPLDSLLPIQASAVTRSGGAPACYAPCRVCCTAYNPHRRHSRTRASPITCSSSSSTPTTAVQSCSQPPDVGNARSSSLQPQFQYAPHFGQNRSLTPRS
jgi:hypothetical protein